MLMNRLITEDMEVTALPATATVLEATRLMVGQHRGSVLVTDDSGAPMGIFTERDLMVRVVSEGISTKETLLQEVMTTELYVAHPDDKVTTIRREMRERHIRHIPVIDSDGVVAVLSMRDLLRADFEETREAAAAMRTYIQGEAS